MKKKQHFRFSGDARLNIWIAMNSLKRARFHHNICESNIASKLCGILRFARFLNRVFSPLLAAGCSCYSRCASYCCTITRATIVLVFICAVLHVCERLFVVFSPPRTTSMTIRRWARHCMSERANPAFEWANILFTFRFAVYVLVCAIEICCWREQERLRCTWVMLSLSIR